LAVVDTELLRPVCPNLLGQAQMSKKKGVKQELPANILPLNTAGPQVVNTINDQKFIQRATQRRKVWTAGHEAYLVEAMMWATPKEPRNLWSKIRRDPRFFHVLGQYNGVELRNRWSALELDYYRKIIPRCYYSADTVETAGYEAGALPQEVTEQLPISAMVNQAETSDSNAPLAKAAAAASAVWRVNNPPAYIPPSKLGRHSVPSSALHVYQDKEGFITTQLNELPIGRCPISYSASLMPPLMGPDVGACDSDDEEDQMDIEGLAYELLEDRRTSYAFKMTIPGKLQQIHAERKAAKAERKRAGLPFTKPGEKKAQELTDSDAMGVASVKNEDESDDEWSEDSDDESATMSAAGSANGVPRWARPKIVRLWKKKEKQAEDSLRRQLIDDIRFYYQHRRELVKFEDEAEIAAQQTAAQQALTLAAQQAATGNQPYVAPQTVTPASVTAVNVIYPLKSLKTYLTCRCGMPLHLVFSVLRRIHSAPNPVQRREILNECVYSLFANNPTARLHYRKDYFGGTRHASLTVPLGGSNAEASQQQQQAK